MTQKLIILAIRYPEEKEKEVEKLLNKMLPLETAAKINMEIGEIWKPYQGEYDKRVDGLIEDLILFNATKEERQNNKLIKKILMKRCKTVQNMLKKLGKDSEEDLAYSTINHVAHCTCCQNYVSEHFNIGGNKEIELYIQRKLNGERFEKL